MSGRGKGGKEKPHLFIGSLEDLIIGPVIHYFLCECISLVVKHYVLVLFD